MEIELLKISEEDLKDSCLIVKLGTDNRPASEEDMDDMEKALQGLFSAMQLDFNPPVLVTHHALSFETISREQCKDLVNAFLSK